MLLNNQQIIEEIKKEIKICIEMNENENTTEQSKSVLSLHHHQDLQTVLQPGTEERALLSCGN